MRRNLERLANEEFDLLLIGGGITGACIARDAAMRGLKVTLIEKKDFANATSAHNSKLIHGGLRYLRNLEFGLVRESLRERRTWQRIAPHLVQPLPFLIPMFGGGIKERASLTAGLTLYDVLSYDRTWLADPDQRLPRHRWLNKSEAIARAPILDQKNFQGAFQYYDAQMFSPERLALENVLDANAHGAAVANYVEAIGLTFRNGRVEGAKVRAAFGGNAFDIRAKFTIITAGPWADIFLSQALGKPSSHKLLRSKGIHLIVPPITREMALTIAANGGHFFVLPWRGHSLLGTTDTKFTGQPDSVGVTSRDIQEFLSFIDLHLPGANLKPTMVEHFYAGLRPLVDDGTGDTYDASRRAELVDHGKDDGIDGLFSAIGGKWTTSRDLAEKVTDVIVNRLDTKTSRCTTAVTPLPGGRIERFRMFADEQRRQYPGISSIEYLSRLYGARLPAMLSTHADTASMAPVGANGDIAIQIDYATKEEMAVALEDAIMRRTGIGQLGRPTTATLEQTAAIMGAELGWDEDRKKNEIASLDRNFSLVSE
jgi:glycerol-3-phosphate dehydrogenase